MLKSKAINFLFQCLSLGSPLARVVAFSIIIIVLIFVDVSSLGFPNFCIWEMFFGYCPANGTTRALNAFFHGKWEEAIKYNLNVLVAIPLIIGILVADILKLVKSLARNILSNEYKEIKLALSIVWLVLSLVILMILITPFILPDDTILALSPKCEWKTKYNKSCPLCGMTTAFILISRGKLSEAFTANKFSLYLYYIFILNEVTITVFLTKTFLTKKKGGKTMSGNANNTATRVCEWCAESIPQQALRCPRCQKWRKDIDKERVLAYVWACASIFPALLFVIGMRNGWWHRMKGFLAYEFSIGAFITSFSGLAVLAGFIMTSYLCWHYYAKVSRKIGSWWWF